MAKVAERRLLKAGELAKKTGLLVTTIRYYTKLGLLRPAGFTPGKYNLYDEELSFERIKAINVLKKERFTLDEIIGEFKSNGFGDK